MCVSVNTFKHDISGPIEITFYLKHHVSGRKDALGFGPDQIRTLVSMATDTSHMVIMGENVVTTLVPSFSIRYSSFLQVMRTTISSRMNELEI